MHINNLKVKSVDKHERKKAETTFVHTKWNKRLLIYKANIINGTLKEKTTS
jgi:hypothetical protein